MRRLTPEEIAQVEDEANTAISDYFGETGDSVKKEYGEDGAFIIVNLVAHIRLIEHELECYRTKHDPPFEPSPPTLPKRMAKVIRRPSHLTES